MSYMYVYIKTIHVNSLLTHVYTHFLALQIMTSFSCLQDYVHFSLARHCFSLQRLRDARLAFEHLLGHESVQTAHQQMHNLREYIYVHKVHQCLISIHV